MKIGDTKKIHGITIKMVSGSQGCYTCDLRTLDRDDLTISQRRQMDILCAAMPSDCREIEADYKIDGVLV